MFDGFANNNNNKYKEKTNIFFPNTCKGKETYVEFLRPFDIENL